MVCVQAVFARNNCQVDELPPTPISPDYDRDPGRFRLARSVLRQHALAPDVHERVARRFVVEGLTPVLDVGMRRGGTGHTPAGGPRCPRRGRRRPTSR